MSGDDDRIRVPGNGHDRTVLLDPASPAAALPHATPTAAPTPSTSPGASAAAASQQSGMGRPDLTIALTPGQLAVGFGVIVSLVLLALGRRHRGR